MKLQTFEVDFCGVSLKGDKCEHNCNTVILHGAGNSSRVRFKKLRESLNVKGLPSLCFDFIGHGQTGGEITDTTLQKRSEQASTVIKQHMTKISCLIGSSMSAYTAIKLTETLEIENLVLMVPAVYTPKAYNLSFGSEFSKVIRVQNSWLDSDAFTALKMFKGNLLIIAAQNDHVIPSAVVEKIYDSAQNTNTRKLHIVADAQHINLFPRDCDFDLAVNLIYDVVNS